MAQGTQAIGGGHLEAGLGVEQAGVEAPARRVAGGLGVLFVIQHAHQGLGVSLGLHVPAHDAETHHRFSVAREEGRDDGVEGSLARAHQVVAGLVQREAVASVLQAQAVARHDHARTKAHVIALDEADHHAAGIGGTQVDGAALGLVARAVVLGAQRVDQLGAAGQVGVVQHLGGAQAHGARLGHVLVDVGKGQLHGFDLQVLARHAIHRQRRHVEVLQDPQCNECGDALPVGRNFVHRVAAVVLLNRLDPLGPVGREVGGRHRTAMGLGVRCCGFGHLASVEGFALGAGNQFQGAGGVVELKALAHTRLAAARQKSLREAGLCGDLAQGGCVAPLLLHDDGHRITAFSHFDGWRQQVGKGQLAKAVTQGHPAAHGTRHGDRVPAALGRRGRVGAVLVDEILGRPGLRCTATGVQAVQGLAVPQDAERIRTQAVAAGLHQRHHRGGGDGGVYRIAAGLQHAQARLRGQRVRRADDVARKHRAALAGVTGGPIKSVGRVHGWLTRR